MKIKLETKEVEARIKNDFTKGEWVPLKKYNILLKLEERMKKLKRILK